MTGNPIGPTGTVRLATPTSHLTTNQDAGAYPDRGPAPLADRTFAMRFTSTPRGARLARRLTAVRLDAWWGIPYDTDAHDEIVLIVAELTANAVMHGHVPGRDFHLRVHAPPDAASTSSPPCFETAPSTSRPHRLQLDEDRSGTFWRSASKSGGSCCNDRAAHTTSR